MITANDVRKLAKEENVRYLRMTFTDALGALKNIEIPIALLDDALNNKIKIDGSSIKGFLPIEHADMYLYPDPNTWRIYPWVADKNKTASMICDVHDVDGTPFVGDPRSILQKELKLVKDLGYDTFDIGAEPEYFLFKADENGNPTMKVNDDGFYFDLEPKDLGEACRRETTNVLTKMGFQVEADHHEAAAGQHEIDFKFDKALYTADNIQYFKLTVRRIAQDFGLCATFMPKPITGINGSGMHLNMSLFNGGTNKFDDPNGEKGLSKEALYFLGGVLKHAAAITAVANPTINSYKRLVPGYEAPTYVAWAISNRTPLVRVPAGRGKLTRLELRSGDPTANPYIAIAAALAAGIDGIKNKIEAPAPVEHNIYQMTPEQRDKVGITQLPGSLSKAIEDLNNDSVVKDALGDYFVNKFTELKQDEIDTYKTNVTEWEHKEYFDN